MGTLDTLDMWVMERTVAQVYGTSSVTNPRLMLTAGRSSVLLTRSAGSRFNI